SFTTAELLPRGLDALGSDADRYTLASLRYDLSEFRVKGLVDKLPPHSRRYPARAFSVPATGGRANRAAMWSASRSASATMVNVGMSEPQVGNTELPAT